MVSSKQKQFSYEQALDNNIKEKLYFNRQKSLSVAWHRGGLPCHMNDFIERDKQSQRERVREIER